MCILWILIWNLETLTISILCPFRLNLKAGNVDCKDFGKREFVEAYGALEARASVGEKLLRIVTCHCLEITFWFLIWSHYHVLNT